MRRWVVAILVDDVATRRWVVAILVATNVVNEIARMPVPVNAIITACSIVYLGATRSLMKLLRRKPPSYDSVTLSTRDAMRFPLWSACVLITTYALIKIFGNIDYLLLVYLCALGVYAEPVPGRPRLSLAVVLVTVGTYGATRHWLLNNLIATCLAATALDIVNAGSFATASILLCGLFFYDIYFVFATDVMVTVAKGIQGPVTLRFPRAQGYSMLGLGDVFVPGLLVSLLLRFDAKNAGYAQNFRAPFFGGAMLAYAGGLALNYYILYAYDTPQPALLYLVPATLGVALATAFFKGQLNLLLNYCDDDAAASVLSSPVDSSSGGGGGGEPSDPPQEAGAMLRPPPATKAE